MNGSIDGERLSVHEGVLGQGDLSQQWCKGARLVAMGDEGVTKGAKVELAASCVHVRECGAARATARKEASKQRSDFLMLILPLSFSGPTLCLVRFSFDSLCSDAP